MHTAQQHSVVPPATAHPGVEQWQPDPFVMHAQNWQMQREPESQSQNDGSQPDSSNGGMNSAHGQWVPPDQRPGWVSNQAMPQGPVYGSMPMQNPYMPNPYPLHMQHMYQNGPGGFAPRHHQPPPTTPSMSEWEQSHQ